MGANSFSITHRSSLRQGWRTYFISYSRKDSDFVTMLAAALKTADHDTWVDVEGIRASEDWKTKIFREIDAAGTFLFVVSPDSLQSEVAGEEVSHAALNNKRMIPLFYRGANYDSLPKALGRFQGIKFDDDGLFPTGLGQLLHTLETDLDWVDAHTRLLNRALEWEKEKKDRSFLLRGKDLNEAEQMVARASDREPKLTALQSEYILASRQTDDEDAADRSWSGVDRARGCLWFGSLCVRSKKQGAVAKELAAYRKGQPE